MKRRQYAIIIEEDGLQNIWEFHEVIDAVEYIICNTYGYLWYEEDALPSDCIESKNFIGLRQYLLSINKEEKHNAVNTYCDALEKIYRVKHINQLKKVIKMFNTFLIQLGIDTSIDLDSRKIFYKEQIGPCWL